MGAAADSVWAMVSGLPRGRRERRRFVVLQAYIDDSTTDGHCLILAGYVADAKRWASFSDAWQAELDTPPIWPRFKMTAINHWRKDPTGDRLRRFYKIILDHVVAEFCVAIPIEPLRRIASEFGMSEQDKNPYYAAWNSMMVLYAEYAKRLRIHEPIDFYFDDQSEKSKITIGWDHFHSIMPRRWRKMFRQIAIYRQDDEFLPLQAADFVAWHKRKQYIETGSILSSDGIHPWDTEPPSRALLYGELDEDGLREVLLSATRPQKIGFKSSFRMTSYGVGWTGSWDRPAWEAQE